MRARHQIIAATLLLSAWALQAEAAFAEVNQNFTRQELETFVAESEIPDGVDRACVLEHAWSVRRSIPAVGLVTPGNQPREFQARTQMIVRHVRMGQARDAGVAHCSQVEAPASEAPN